MIVCRAAGVPREPGFTLLELLVAFTILGLLAALLFSGFRFGTQVWRTGDRELEAMVELQAAHGVIRRELTRIVPPDDILETEDGDGAPPLLGLSDGLSFVAPSPAEALPGGLYRMAIVIEPGARGNLLRLSWQLVVPAGREANAVGATGEVVLLDGIRRLHVQYFGSMEDGSGSDWQEQWDNPQALPRLIWMKIEFEDGDPRVWPDLFVAPLLSPRTI
jgi:general secretion pathway protein J